MAFGADPTAYGVSTYYSALTNSCIDFVWKALELGGLNPSGFQGAVWPTWNREFLDNALSAYANPSGTTLIDDGQGNTIIPSYDDGGELTGYSWETTDGSHGTVTINANGSRFGESYDPDGNYSTFSYPSNGSETLFQALNSGTLLDALSLLRAIQSGDPLPVVSSGLRLAAGLDTLDGKIDSIGLAGASNVAGGALSLLSLKNALDRGDTFAAITAGAQALSFGAQAYANFAGFSGKDALVQAFGADSFVAQIGGNLPYLNLVAALESGDEIGIGMAALAFTPAAPISVAYQVFSLASSLFGDDDPPPEPWGGASAGWSGFNVVANSWGEHGGEGAARSTMDGFINYLNQLAEYEQSVNPGAAIGVVANRLPSISYRHYSGFQLTDIDPVTGVQNYPGIKYDLSGHPYNAPAGTEQAGQSLSERFIRVALARGAIAPMWEVETAALQTLAGDPKAGLTEEERAEDDIGQQWPLAA